MILAACLDAGLDLDLLRQDLAKLALPGYTIDAQKVRKEGFAATQFEVVIDEAAPRKHRHLKHVIEIIEAGQVPPRVRERAVAIFTRLAEAEAAVHGTSVEKVHFHEVGAVDAIVDVVGACMALERLEIEQVHVSPIPTGSGTVRCEHGLMPVPAPATAMLLRGVPLADCEEQGELITPTGAAILTTLAAGYGPLPAMTLQSVGVGAGRRAGKTRPNLLRLMIGQVADAAPADESDQLLVLEANLDDASGQVLGHVCKLLLEAGARDVFTVPIYMKKNRPATLIIVLAPPELREAMEEILFRETTTFGVRSHLAQRRILAREMVTVTTQFGDIRVKVGKRAGQLVRVTPEYEDCRAAAERSGQPLIDVIEAARRAWQQLNP